MDTDKCKEFNTLDVQKIYEMFDEDKRLIRSKAARVEYLTTVHYIDQYIKKGNIILDVGAGTGIYSLHYANLGFKVHAVELAKTNYDRFKQKLKDNLDLTLIQGNALDLSNYSDNSFDLVLLMGPLYHLNQINDQKKTIKEALRVLKNDGYLFISFISNDMVFLTEFLYDSSFFESDKYNHATFDLVDSPFVFHTVDEAIELTKSFPVEIVAKIAQDGVSELLSENINKMSEKSYYQYLKYHLHCAQKEELLGHSNHILFICQKKG